MADTPQTPKPGAGGGGVKTRVLLANLLPHIVEWGNVASVGLAGGAEFSTSVYPFILRGVSLLGASSANSPGSRRQSSASAKHTVARGIPLDRFRPTGTNRRSACGNADPTMQSPARPGRSRRGSTATFARAPIG